MNTAGEILLGFMGQQRDLPTTEEQNYPMAQYQTGAPAYAGGYGAPSAGPGYQYNPNAAAMWGNPYSVGGGMTSGQSLGTGAFAGSDITAFPFFV